MEITAKSMREIAEASMENSKEEVLKDMLDRVKAMAAFGNFTATRAFTNLEVAKYVEAYFSEPSLGFKVNLITYSNGSIYLEVSW